MISSSPKPSSASIKTSINNIVSENANSDSPFMYPIIKATPPVAPFPQIQQLRHSQSASKIDELLDSRKKHDELQKQLFLQQRSGVLSLIASTSGLLEELSGEHTRMLHYPSNLSDFSRPNNKAKLWKFDILKVNCGDRVDLIDKLDDASVATLLQQRLLGCLSHLSKLAARVEDTTSKVLVTGDLNAGKSTLVNALLRREILPHDQQPCTSSFCEVIDASRNDNREEVHAITNPSQYNVQDRTTFNTFTPQHLKSLLSHTHHSSLESSSHSLTPTSSTSTRSTIAKDVRLVKVYCNEGGTRIPGESLLNNGVADVTIIDSPGLNRDLSKTMAVFAQHEQIDAVVFVLNAENHFTLSGSEFMLEASKEKPVMFVVVNRFDLIDDKDRCTRVILEQLRELSPETFADAKEFVHFISAKETLSRHISSPTSSPSTPSSHLLKPQQLSSDFAFSQFESNLRTFLLEKRSLSKLMPAQSYLKKLLLEVNSLATFNLLRVGQQQTQATSALQTTEPIYTRLRLLKDRYLFHIDQSSEDAIRLITANTHDSLERWLESIDSLAMDVDYPGLLYVWCFADAISHHCLQQLNHQLAQVERFSDSSVTSCITSMHRFADGEVPNWERLCSLEEVASSCEIISHQNRQHLLSSSSGQPSHSHLQLVHAPCPVLEVNVEFGDFLEFPSTTGFMGAALGSLSVVASSLIGYRRVAVSLYRASGWFGLGSGNYRMATASIFLLGAGSIAFLLSDAKNTVRKRVVQKLRREIRLTDAFPKHTHRIVRTSRRALDHASFEFKKVFCNSLDSHEKLYREWKTKLEMAEQHGLFFSRIDQESKGLMSILDSVGATHIHHHHVVHQLCQ